MIKYDKLVRDKIPEIIADSGKKATFRVAGKDEYISYLEKKLDEEVAEFHESKSIEELVDIYEVIDALARQKRDKWYPNILEDERKDKVLRNGAFSHRIILIESEE